MAEQLSWVSLPYCSLPRSPLPIRSLALSAHVPPKNIHFWILDKSPIWALGRVPLPSTKIVTSFISLGSKITADGDCSHFIKRCLLLGRKAMTNLDFGNKGPYSQSYGLSSSHVWMWELRHKEGWALKNWYFQTVVLEKTRESLEQQISNQSILKEINSEC